MAIVLDITPEDIPAIVDALDYWMQSSAGDFGRVPEGQEPADLYEARRLIVGIVAQLEDVADGR